MSIIRVRCLSQYTTPDELKVYFSNPRNGGGPIQKIYYPLLSNDAVILFENDSVGAQLKSIDSHYVSGEDVEILVMPPMVFSTIEAKVDPAISSMIKTTSRCEDHLKYLCDIEVHFNEEQICTLKGNLFQIEMAWRIINHFLEQQHQIHSKLLQENQSSSSVRRRRGSRESTRKNEDSFQALNGSDLYNERQTHEKQVYSRDYDSPGNHVNSYSSHKYSHRLDSQEHASRNGHGVSPGFQERQRPSTSPGAELKDEMRHDTEDYEKLFETSKSASGRSSKESSVNSASYGPSHVEAVNIPSPYPGGNTYTVKREINSEKSLSSMRSNKAPVFNTVYPEDSSDEEMSGNYTHRGRMSDANETFEKFSSLKSASVQRSVPEKGILKSSKRETERPGSSQGRGTASDKRKFDPVQVTRESESHYSGMAREPSSATHGDPHMSSVDAVDAILKSMKLPTSNCSDASPISGGSLIDPSVCSFTFNVGQLEIVVYQGNITDVETEGLVNAANGSLANGAGVSGAIARAASPTMQRECDAYIKRNGIMSTSDVMHTGAGGKISGKVSHILHAVGPIWLESLPDRCIYELILTYVKLFRYAEKLWLSSITLPCISSGIFGSPLEVSVKCFLDGILIYNSEIADRVHLKRIYLVNNDHEAVVTSIAILQSLLDLGQDQLTAQALERFARLQEKRRSAIKRSNKTVVRSAEVKDDLNTDLQTPRHEASSTKAGGSTKRRSSSLSRISRSRPKEEESAVQGKNLNSSLKGLSVAGNSSFDTPRKVSSGDRSSRGSGRPTTPLSNRPSSSSEKNSTKDKKSPRNAPGIKPSLLTTSPTSAGAKPKTYSVIKSSSKNTPLKASTAVVTNSVATGTDMTKQSNGDDRPWSSKYKDFSDDNERSYHSLPVQLDGGKQDKPKYCKVCYGNVKNPKTLYKCGHTFCLECVESHFRKYGQKCPECREVYSSSTLKSGSSSSVSGTQPPGSMSYHTKRNLLIPGYEYCDGAIEIHYDIPSGKQYKNHPHPGEKYAGVQHKAYLPNNADGRQVLRLLEKAFDANMVFRMSNRGIIEWNIPHKTSYRGTSADGGYPDSNYLKLVRDDLAKKGFR